MLLLKPGVQVTPNWAGFIILTVLRRVSAEMQIDITITSGSDGDHSGPRDPHKSGEAFDIRSHGFSESTKAELLHRIQLHLSPQRFYAFLESPGEVNEHFHIQRKRDTTYTVSELLKENV